MKNFANIDFIKNYTGLALMILLFTQPSSGQESGFDAAIIGGISASQIRGDDLAGFSKVGIESGVSVSYPIRYNMALGVELLYSQRGSQPRLQFGSNQVTPIYHLSYLTIPVIWNIQDWFFEVNPDVFYHKVRAELGFSFSRLLNAEITGDLGQVGTEELTNAFEDFDISWIVGGAFQFNQHWGLGVRYNRSVNKLFSRDKNPEINQGDLRTYFLSIRLMYNL